MEFKNELSSKQKLGIATKLEIIFDKTYAVKVLGLNLRQYDNYKLKPMTNAEFKNYRRGR